MICWILSKRENEKERTREREREREKNIETYIDILTEKPMLHKPKMKTDKNDTQHHISERKDREALTSTE